MHTILFSFTNNILFYAYIGRYIYYIIYIRVKDSYVKLNEKVSPTL